MVSLGEFLILPTNEIARLVRTAGSQVCVFPNDGTRRWFMLEHANNVTGDLFAAYQVAGVHRHAELYRIFFDHGIDTLLAPIFGGETLKRGDDYMEKVALNGLLQFAENPEFIHLYDEYQVRVRFYGDYSKHLSGIPRAERIIDAFEAISARTRAHNHHRLFFGLFANNATETMAELAIRSFQETGTIPDHHRLVELYYGEYIEPANLYIGFEKFCAFDYPLLASGVEDLYFMVAPSSYLEEKQLRLILYDHLYTRRVEDPDYYSLSPEDLSWLKEFYKTNKEVVLGTGIIKAGTWIPTSNLTLQE